MRFIGVGVGIIIVLGVGMVLWRSQRQGHIPYTAPSPQVSLVSPTPMAVSSVTASAPLQPSPVASPSPAVTSSSFGTPVDDFLGRITKKKFGTYVTPKNSPIQPERFTGYHTGVDVEYGDVVGEVPVYAIADGEVILARTASGYGGVVAIRHMLEGKSVGAIYGHLAPSSLPRVGERVVKGQTIGRLGQAYSSETDGERKHLHFALLKNSTTDIRGYVQSQSELDKWYNPLDFYSGR